MFRRRRTSASVTDPLLVEAHAAIATAEAALRDELDAACATLAAALAGGRPVSEVSVDPVRGSLLVRSGDCSYMCATASTDAAEQVAAMVTLEPTVVRPGRIERGTLWLAFYSQNWAYALPVTPVLP